MTKDREVKGSVIVDLANLINQLPDEPWADHLPPEDLQSTRANFFSFPRPRRQSLARGLWG